MPPATLSRRRLISLGAAALAGAAAAPLLAACGGGSESEPTGTVGASSTAPSSTVETSPQASPAAAETAAGGSSSAGRGGTLRVVYAEEPVNLHPQIQSGTEGWYVQKQIVDGLVNIDPNGNIVPGLAVDLPEQLDDVTYVFTLREGVTFHNGKPFTADDVVWTFDRLLGKFPDLQSSQAARFKAQIESVEKIDDTHVKIVLTKPWSDFLIIMASDKYMCIMQKDAELEAGEAYGQSVVVGTGPFKFKEWVKGDHLTLVRNEDYWGEPACVDEIVYKAIPEEATRTAGLAAGEIDLLLDPPLKDVQDYENNPDYRVQVADGGDLKMVIFNTTQPPFNDVRVRQAVNLAIDRQEIVDSIYYGYAAVATDLLPPWHPAHDPNNSLYSYDPDRASQLLTEAGYGAGKSLEFELVVTDATEFVDLATLIQAQLERVGVKASILPLDKSAFYQKTFPQQGTANPGFQASVYRLKYGLATTDYTYRTYHPSSTISQSGYNQPGGAQNPEVLDLLDQAAQVSDVEKQRELYGRLAQLINQDVPAITLAIQANVNISRAAVTGLGITVLDVMPFKDVCVEG